MEYDLILLDMNMQEKNGIEVAKELRSQKIETPIIYISAYNVQIELRLLKLYLWKAINGMC